MLRAQWEAQQPWGKVRMSPGQDLPFKWEANTHKKFCFLCDCGKEFVTSFSKITKGHTKSCGRCSWKPKEYWLGLGAWGKLTLDTSLPLPEEWGSGSGKLFPFICECGRDVSVSFGAVSSGKSQSCGRCNHKPKEYWLEQRWGSLTLSPDQELPDEWSYASNKKRKFTCSCGRELTSNFQTVHLGTKSCGKCKCQSKEYWLKKKWGDLRLDPSQDLPEEWHAGSGFLYSFLCECGRKTTRCFYEINKNLGVGSSCGKCAYLTQAEWIARQPFGSLRLDSDQKLPDEWGRGCLTKFKFICSCGRGVNLSFNQIMHSYRSCGRCNDKPKEHWLDQKWGILRLDPNQELPDEWGTGASYEFRVLCDCGSSTRSMVFYNLIRAKSCGCLGVGQNDYSPENTVRQFVASLANDTHPTSWLIEGSRKSYDVYIPSLKLAVEFHGLIWHSEWVQDKDRTKGDHAKYLLARERGDRLIQLYEDEWRDKREIIKEMLRSLIQSSAGKRIKPEFEVHYETPKEAQGFLNKHHYLGAAGGCVTICAKHKGEMVGVWVFMKRETGTVLWHRACWNHKYKAWNPHEKALALAIPELKALGFTRIITFSDNRFHTGGLYEKLGFKFEKELKPDYGYTDKTTRVSKYALRVKAGVDEQAEAEAKGWFRIWDSGKKRFSMEIK